MKKILFISDFSFKIPGGAQKSMEIIMNGLSNEYEFYVVMPGKKYDCSNEKFKCIFIEEYETLLANESLIKTYRLLKILNKIIKDINPDIIHPHMVSGMSLIEVLTLLGLIKCKTIYTERGVADQYSKVNRFLIKKMCKNFSKVVTTTEYNKNLYFDLYQCHKDKIDVIPNTAGPLFERNIKKNSENLKLNIMFNARLVYNKNWDLSFEIIKWLSENYDFNYTVIVGTDNTEESKKQYENLAKKTRESIKKGNFYIDSNLSLSQLYELYNKSDIFIMTSRSESFGRTALEAMATKNVIFATNIDGLSEVIGNEEYLFKDLKEFKNKFLNFMKKNLKEEKEKFYNRFIQNYSLDTNLKLYKELYDNILFGKNKSE